MRDVRWGESPVGNDQVTLASGLPALSLMADAPPVRLTVYRVLAACVALGLGVATRLVALYLTTAVIATPGGRGATSESRAAKPDGPVT